jgi:hypothetical protein
MNRHPVTRIAVCEAARVLLGEAAVHRDVSPEHSEEFDRMRRASGLHDVRYLWKIARRARRLAELKSQVEGLPDCLDARDERRIDAHSLTAAWLAGQFEVFDEQMRRVDQQMKSN